MSFECTLMKFLKIQGSHYNTASIFFLSQNRKLPLTFLQRIISFFFFQFLTLKYESQIWNWFSNFFTLFPSISRVVSKDKNVRI